MNEGRGEWMSKQVPARGGAALCREAGRQEGWWDGGAGGGTEERQVI